MKFKSISQTVPQSVQVLFKVKWETDLKPQTYQNAQK